MKRLAKKSLSVLLALIIATTLFVPAFAANSDTDDMLYFSADINYKNNQLNYFYFVVEGYAVYNEDTFACSIYDSSNNEVFNETMGEISHILPEDIELEEVPDFIWVNVSVLDTVILDPNETYTLVIAVGSFSTADEELSPALSRTFLASDYIYVPTIWDKILSFLHSNRFLEFIFARLIMIIEFFYYGMPLSGFPIG